MPRVTNCLIGTETKSTLARGTQLFVIVTIELFKCKLACETLFPFHQNLCACFYLFYVLQEGQNGEVSYWR